MRFSVVLIPFVAASSMAAPGNLEERQLTCTVQALCSFINSAAGCPGVTDPVVSALSSYGIIKRCWHKLLLVSCLGMCLKAKNGWLQISNSQQVTAARGIVGAACPPPPWDRHHKRHITHPRLLYNDKNQRRTWNPSILERNNGNNSLENTKAKKNWFKYCCSWF